MSSVAIIPYHLFWSLQQDFSGHIFYVIQKFVGIGGKLGTIALEEWS
jgi:hypothetical protein